jgi:hypothetical protein
MEQVYLVEKNLGIIVPYRDRADHLQLFVPHIAAFFSRDAKNVGGNISITIVEQEHGLEFNRGLMNNIGYALSKERCDYVCFHDVDYLPVSADYSAPDGFATIAWYKQQRADPRGFIIKDKLEFFFGGVVLFRKDAFEQVNGFANAYWGWGFEDNDIANRCVLETVPILRRKGTFKVLSHINRGFDLSGGTTTRSAANKRNFELFKQRFAFPARWHPSASELDVNRQTCMKESDGLSTIEFAILERKSIPSPLTDGRGLKIEIVTVSIKGPK